MTSDLRQGADKACRVSQPADPRVRRTRKLLEDAFRALIKQKSFAALSVRDITDYATVNRATFYAHYTDKHDLATSVLRNDLRHSMFGRFQERPTFTSENLVEMATMLFEFLQAINSACPNTESELSGTVENALNEEFCDIIEHWLGVDKSYVRLFPGCSKSTVATVISCSIYGGALRWVRSPKSEREPASHICREIVSMLLPPSR